MRPKLLNEFHSPAEYETTLHGLRGTNYASPVMGQAVGKIICYFYYKRYEMSWKSTCGSGILVLKIHSSVFLSFNTKF